MSTLAAAREATRTEAPEFSEGMLVTIQQPVRGNTDYTWPVGSKATVIAAEGSRVSIRLRAGCFSDSATVDASVIKAAE